MKAWLITNKYYISDSFLNLKKQLVDAANKKGIELIEYNNVDIVKYIFNSNYVKPDFVLFWDKDIKLASLLESDGIKVFNSSESIRLCDDKSLTYLKLKNKGIKQPKTFFSPLLYYHNLSENNDILNFIINELGLPFVFKECFGSFGKQVSLVNSKSELIEKIKNVDTWPYIMQEFVNSSFGKDLRIYVVGDSVVASMKRENISGDFRANIEVGSRGTIYNASDEQKKLVKKIVKELGLSFGGIDLLFGKDNEPIFCEANSNDYFNEITKVTNVKVEDYIFDYILKNIC